MSEQPSQSAAARLLLASRRKSGRAGSALAAALGMHPTAIQQEIMQARHSNLIPEPGIPEPNCRTSNPLTSVSELGPLVRSARRAMKMNQAQFAAHAGVGRRFVSELEGGKSSLEFDKVLACSRAAGIDLFAKTRRV